MVKGIEKRIVYLKNTGSPMFCEAYFIVNEKYRDSKKLRDADLVSEATRLIEDSISRSKEGFFKRAGKAVLALLKKQGMSFAIGVLLTVIAVLVIL